MAALAGSATTLSGRRDGWIYKPSWDLSVLIGSAVLVPLPFLVAWSAQISGWIREQQAIDLINIVVATLIGGLDGGWIITNALASALLGYVVMSYATAPRVRDEFALAASA